jgi:hypothetical protein
VDSFVYKMETTDPTSSRSYLFATSPGTAPSARSACVRPPAIRQCARRSGRSWRRTELNGGNGWAAVRWAMVSP